MRRVVDINVERISIFVAQEPGVPRPEAMDARPVSIAAAEDWLNTKQLSRTSEWRTLTGYDGLHLEADVEMVT